MDAKDAEIDDKLMPVNAAIRDWIPGNPSPATKARWYTRGIAGLDGERIRLPVWYVGRKPHTTQAAVRKWLDDVTAARMARIDGRHTSHADVTEDELQAAGLLGRTNRGAT
jgi:hypothetical protein